jgi:hypothetical protein
VAFFGKIVVFGGLLWKNSGLWWFGPLQRYIFSLKGWLLWLGLAFALL